MLPLKINTQIYCYNSAKNGYIEINSANGSLVFSRVSTYEIIPYSSLSNTALFERNSVDIGILDRAGYTVTVDTTEIFLETGHLVYYKEDVFRLISDAGICEPPLMFHIASPQDMEIRAYPPEPFMQIFNFKIIPTVVNPLGYLFVNRSDVEIRNLDISATEATATLHTQGVQVNRAVNVRFVECTFNNFRHFIQESGGRSGYGVLLRRTVDVVFDNCLSSNCKHCISARIDKRTLVQGGRYRCDGTGAPIDSHLGYRNIVRNATLYCKNKPTISFTGESLTIKDCDIIDTNIVVANRDEITGNVIIENNTVDFSTAANNAFFGFETATEPPDVNRQLNSPDAVSIRRNLIVTTDLVWNFLRLHDVFADIKPIRNVIIDENDSLVEYATGVGAPSTNGTLAIFDISGVDYNPKITVKNTKFKLERNSIAITNRSTTTPYRFEVEVYNSHNVNLKNDIDACATFKLYNSSILNIRGNKDRSPNLPSYIYEFDSCTLPDGFVLFRSSCRLGLKNCKIGTFVFTTDPSGIPNVISSRTDAVAYAISNFCDKDIPQASMLPLNGYFAANTYRTQSIVGSTKTSADFTTAELLNFEMGYRTDLNQLQINVNGTIRKITLT